MKTATVPAVRVEPELRARIEALLRPNESLSVFIETSLRSEVESRLMDQEFLARGLASARSAHHEGSHIPAAAVLAEMAQRLEQAQANQK